MKLNLPNYSKFKIFQKSALFILIFFMGLMVYVTAIAMVRKSGSTHLDMGKVQQLRYVEETPQKAI